MTKDRKFDRAEAKRLRDDGLSYRQIGKALGCSGVNIMHGLKSQYGESAVASSERRFDPVEGKRLLDEGMNYFQIAKETGFSHSTVAKSMMRAFEAGLTQRPDRRRLDVNRAKRLRDAGMTYRAIGAELGFTRRTISKKLSATFGPEPEKPRRWDLKEAVMLRDAGMSYRKIGERFGYSYMAVRKRLLEAGVTEPRELIDKSEVIRLRREGRMLKEIASELGFTISGVAMVLNRHANSESGAAQ